MKKIFTIGFLLLSAILLHSQTVERFVVSSSGSSYSGPTLQVDYTVGEAVISTVSNTNNILTQGFQQPESMITDLDETSSDLNITYYPNPCYDICYISLGNSESETMNVQVYDILGQLITEKDFGLLPGAVNTLT
ncbi:MAG: T9SS type A sorting domain-containing protein, partial [Bacteroidota bacterium]